MALDNAGPHGLETARRAAQAFSSVLDALESPNAAYDLAAFGLGRIHGTFALPSVRPRYLLQRINTGVFNDPVAVTRNADLVARETHSELQFVRTNDGSLVYDDPEGCSWRMMTFVSGTCAPDVDPANRSPELAHMVAKAFGSFSTQAAHIDPGSIVETLRGFHDTPARYRRLLETTESDRSSAETRSVIEWLADRSDHLGAISGSLSDGELPRRIAHNDAKLDNVLLDSRTGAVRAVIDFDTVMPGSPLFDLGDLLRTVPVSVGEDEPDSSLVTIDRGLVDAVVDGFLVGYTGLADSEHVLVQAAGWVLAMEQGIRYLTDYLEHDRYYSVSRPDQNLRRAQNQFALASQYEAIGWSPP